MKVKRSHGVSDHSLHLTPPCKPTPFRIKELNETVRVNNVSLTELAEDDRYKLQRPETNSIILVESKQFGKPKTAGWKSEQTVEFLPSSCAQEHECHWTQGEQEQEPITANKNKCIFRLKETTRYRVRVIAKLGNKKNEESGEIEINPTEREKEEDGEHKQWLKESRMKQAENEQIKDPCVLAIQNNNDVSDPCPPTSDNYITTTTVASTTTTTTTATTFASTTTEPIADVSEWNLSLREQVLIAFLVLSVLFSLCLVFVLCYREFQKSKYAQCPPDGGDFTLTATSTFLG